MGVLNGVTDWGVGIDPVVGRYGDDKQYAYAWKASLHHGGHRRHDHKNTEETRHRASTGMYSLTFCIRVLLPECHEARSPGRRSNVENAPVDGQSPASQPRPLTIYGAQF